MLQLASHSTSSWWSATRKHTTGQGCPLDAANCARSTALPGSSDAGRNALPLGSAAEGFQGAAIPCHVPQASLPCLLLQAAVGESWGPRAHCCKPRSSAMPGLTAGGRCASAGVACCCALPPPLSMAAAPCHMPPSQPATLAVAGASSCDGCCVAASAAATAVVPLPVA